MEIDKVHAYKKYIEAPLGNFRYLRILRREKLTYGESTLSALTISIKVVDRTIDPINNA